LFLICSMSWFMSVVFPPRVKVCKVFETGALVWYFGSRFGSVYVVKLEKPGAMPGFFGLYFYCSDLGELIGNLDLVWFVEVMWNWGLTGFGVVGLWKKRLDFVASSLDFAPAQRASSLGTPSLRQCGALALRGCLARGAEAPLYVRGNRNRKGNWNLRGN